MKKIHIHLSFLVVILTTIFRCVNAVDPDLTGNHYSTTVENFNVGYDFLTDKVILTWNTQNSSKLSHYTVNRFSKTDIDGKPTDLKTVVVPKGQSNFIDLPDIENTYYTYSITPVFTDTFNSHLRTIIGIESNRIKKFCGKGITFSINRFSNEIAVPFCSLIVTDSFKIIQKLRFTQTVIDGKPQFSEYQTKLSGSYPWTLPLGNGAKTVFAEFSLNLGTIDTLEFTAILKPFKIKLRPENEKKVFTTTSQTGKKEATMLSDSKGVKNYIKGRYLEFSVDINEDSTLAEDFEFWLISNETQGEFSLKFKVLQTVPSIGKLTGIGKYHDIKKRYTYSIDPSTIEGKRNLDRLTLIDTLDPLNYLASQIKDTVISSNPDSAFKLFTALSEKELSATAVKEFILVCKFKGRFFNEDRYAFSFPFSSSEKKDTTKLYFDFYSPNIITALPSSDFYYNNGDTIPPYFTFHLNDDAAVKDKGYSYINEISLIIALADSATLSYWNPVTKKLSKKLSLADLQRMRHKIFPYTLPAPSYQVSKVRWTNLDLSDFASGKYLVGIIVKDEHGLLGLGIGPEITQSETFSNPFMVELITGK